MASDHYFSQEPASNLKYKQVLMEISGSLVPVKTASGTFSPTALDVGTKVLLDKIDLAPKSGNLLDLGCGWGPIALSLASHAPQATVWAVDVNERSLAVTGSNAEDLKLSNIKTATPEQVPKDLEFSGIWSNPPIRIGKAALHQLLTKWLPRLSPGGTAYLVVQKNLGSDSLQKWLAENMPSNFSVDRLDSVKTYRIIRVQRTS